MLIITGPTGVGKTELSLSIADKLNGEIINVDVGQFYKPISIGTAKPNWEAEKIPHHFFDIINDPKDFTVNEYYSLAIEKINEIRSRNKMPIFVGGSGFYIQSLLFPPITQIKSDQISSYSNINSLNLWQKLYEIDPERALKINKNDIYRIERALQIWNQTGIKPSHFLPKYNPLSDFVLLVLTRQRDDLYNRINKRVIQMLDQGWINEVRTLGYDWIPFLKEKKLIGYDDILQFIECNQECDEELLVSTIQKKVRNYAKRQLTFFKTLSKKIINAELLNEKQNIYAKKIIWADLTLPDVNLYINQLSLSLKSLFLK